MKKYISIAFSLFLNQFETFQHFQFQFICNNLNGYVPFGRIEMLSKKKNLASLILIISAKISMINGHYEKWISLWLIAP